MSESVFHPASVSTRTSVIGTVLPAWRWCRTSAARQRSPLPDSSDGLPSALISFMRAVAGVPLAEAARQLVELQALGLLGGNEQEIVAVRVGLGDRQHHGTRNAL